MTGLAEELPVATETGQLRSHPSGFRPKRPFARSAVSGSNVAVSCRCAAEATATASQTLSQD